MTYLIGLLLLALIGCAVTIYRLRRENETLFAALEERDVDNHYLRERNRALNSELLTASRTALYDERANAIAATTKTVSTASLAPDHPQKRKPKSIRGKRK